MNLTKWSYENADAVIAGVGAVGGFVLGLANLGLLGALVGALGAVLFTALIVLAVDPHPPELGPHQ